VWFLCPTVALADQQAKALGRTLPEAFPTIVLSGSDGVDHWSSRNIWETVLDGISVVVCTYQVLLDALIHSFVLLDEIALLVFDEAHHCHGKHPANRILANHYHPARREGGALPHILGLTASPIQNTKDGGLEYVARPGTGMDAKSVQTD
jgi:ERCC4-related helicase